MGLNFPEPRRRHEQRNDSDDMGFPAGRFALLRLIVVLVFALLLLQLLRVQILQGRRFQLLAESNRLKIIPSRPARGLIFDRAGRPLVNNVPAFSVVLTPSLLPKDHPEDVYYALQDALGIPAGDLQRQVDDFLKHASPDQPVTLKSDIDQMAALKLAELRSTMPALDVRPEPARSYPAGPLLSRILGYIGKIDATEYKSLGAKGYEMDDQIGKTGLELSYEDKLRGTPGRRAVEVDASEHDLRTLDEVPPQPGNNLTLAIDSALQSGVTSILADSLTAFHSPSGVAIMMDVHTGEILAYVSLPTYDNNLFSAPISNATLQQLLNDPGRPLVDHAIADQYPPGSTFKEVTGLAALQEGVATATTTIVTDGKLVVPNQANPSQTYTFPDWKNLGTLDFYNGVAMSSDVYFYCLSGGCPQFAHDGLGSDRLARYARMFGLGDRTGIDLPDEVPGIVPDQAWKKRVLPGEPWVTADTYFFGIGQEYLAATPLQMLRVVAAIANGGDILHPHLVRDIRDANGNLLSSFGRQIDRHVDISPQNLAIMRQAMLQVVENGSAPAARVPGIRIGGKSGTAEFGAQITSPSGEAANGTYNEHGWFVSFAPYDNPQVAMVIFHERGGGAATAAPTSSRVWDFYFHQYLPSRTAAADANTTKTAPNR